ncbi:MAG: hypothetical protein V4719_31150 [Planctomycetota bacterium]|jgi:hypothetical protein
MATIKIDPRIIETLADGSHVIHLGSMEIWDGADLAMLRETLIYLHQQLRSRQVSVDMSHVKYVPSGFFGMLFDWHEKGMQMQLHAPQPQITGMLWFRRFFQSISETAYLLNSSSQDTPGPMSPPETPSATCSPQFQTSH